MSYIDNNSTGPRLAPLNFAVKQEIHDDYDERPIAVAPRYFSIERDGFAVLKNIEKRSFFSKRVQCGQQFDANKFTHVFTSESRERAMLVLGISVIFQSTIMNDSADVLNDVVERYQDSLDMLYQHLSRLLKKPEHVQRLEHQVDEAMMGICAEASTSRRILVEVPAPQPLSCPSVMPVLEKEQSSIIAAEPPRPSPRSEEEVYVVEDIKPILIVPVKTAPIKAEPPRRVATLLPIAPRLEAQNRPTPTTSSQKSILPISGKSIIPPHRQFAIAPRPTMTAPPPPQAPQQLRNASTISSPMETHNVYENYPAREEPPLFAPVRVKSNPNNSPIPTTSTVRSSHLEMAKKSFDAKVTSQNAVVAAKPIENATNPKERSASETRKQPQAEEQEPACPVILKRVATQSLARKSMPAPPTSTAASTVARAAAKRNSVGDSSLERAKKIVKRSNSKDVPKQPKTPKATATVSDDRVAANCGSSERSRRDVSSKDLIPNYEVMEILKYARTSNGIKTSAIMTDNNRFLMARVFTTQLWERVFPGRAIGNVASWEQSKVNFIRQQLNRHIPITGPGRERERWLAIVNKHDVNEELTQNKSSEALERGVDTSVGVADGKAPVNESAKVVETSQKAAEPAKKAAKSSEKAVKSKASTPSKYISKSTKNATTSKKAVEMSATQAKSSEKPTESSAKPAKPSEKPTESSAKPAKPSEKPTEWSAKPAKPSEKPTDSSAKPAKPLRTPSTAATNAAIAALLSASNPSFEDVLSELGTM